MFVPRYSHIAGSTQLCRPPVTSVLSNAVGGYSVSSGTGQGEAPFQPVFQLPPHLLQLSKLECHTALFEAFFFTYFLTFSDLKQSHDNDPQFCIFGLHISLSCILRYLVVSPESPLGCLTGISSVALEELETSWVLLQLSSFLPHPTPLPRSRERVAWLRTGSHCRVPTSPELPHPIHQQAMRTPPPRHIPPYPHLSFYFTIHQATSVFCPDYCSSFSVRFPVCTCTPYSLPPPQDLTNMWTFQWPSLASESNPNLTKAHKACCNLVPTSVSNVFSHHCPHAHYSPDTWTFFLFHMPIMPFPFNIWPWLYPFPSSLDNVLLFIQVLVQISPLLRRPFLTVSSRVAGSLSHCSILFSS